MTMKRSIGFLLLALISFTIVPSQVSGTKVKWTGNPDGPEASKVPRSQKYWDENNIQRPDYAKTDAELRQDRQEKRKEDVENGSSMGEGKRMIWIFGCFAGLWAILGWTVLNKVTPGHKLGSSLSSSSSSGTSLVGGSSRNKTFSFGKPTMSLEEKARIARLAKFEGNKQS